jgi:hypothetical protein
MMAMLGTYASSITTKNDGSFGRSFFMQESGPPRWTQQEEQQHLEMAKSDMTAAEIARTLKPTPGSIYSRLQQLYRRKLVHWLGQRKPFTASRGSRDICSTLRRFGVLENAATLAP